MTDTPHPKHIGSFTRYDFCRFCYRKTLIPVIDLGDVPLAGGFLKTPAAFTQETLYPLELSFCQDCFLLQSVNVISGDTLFKDYFYHSSAISTLTTHFTRFTDELLQLLGKRKHLSILEIGSNDGTIIKYLTSKKITALGVDPATNITKSLIKQGLPIINDYFSEKLAQKIKKERGPVDAIISFNTMAHIEDMHDIARGITHLLKPSGVLIFETHYLGNLLKEIQYDMIYHEHQYYYSLLTLEKFFAQYDMEIFDVQKIPIHAGSLRYSIQKKKTGIFPVSKAVAALRKEEKQSGLQTLKPYQQLAKKIQQSRADLREAVTSIIKKKQTVVGYGASGRGTIMMNYCDLNLSLLSSVLDDAPAKQGAYMPGTHQKIVSSAILTGRKKPDYVVLFAWAFWDEIRRRNPDYLKNGGTFIVPLPKVRLLKNHGK